MLDKKRTPPILETNILYLIIGLLLITVGSIFQSIELYSGLLITEYILILLPVLLYLKLRGYSIKKTLRLNRISLKQVIYTIIIMILLYPAAVFFNYIGIILLSKYGRILPNAVPIPTSNKELLLGFIVISITPGICEEVMFRGMIMKSYEVLGKKKAIIYSAILFGVFHFNLQNLLGPIFLGIILGVLLYKTNSIFASALGHITNNLVALIVGFFSTKFNQISRDMSVNLENEMFLYGAVSIGVWAALFGYIAYRLIKAMPEGIEEDLESIEEYNAYEQIVELDIKRQIGNRNMDVIELIPIFIYLIVFCYFNYGYFFR